MSSIYDEVTQVARRTMVLFFLVDTSGSMEGEKIGAVNSAIEDVIPEIKRISEENADAQIKIAVMNFATNAVWMTPEPIDSEDFSWQYLSAEGLTAFGEMCLKLNEKLSRNEFMNNATGSFAPAIFLLSDGEPTDEYNDALELLRANNWFKKAIKVALAIGDDANHDVLMDFTGSRESILTVYSPETMRKMIKFVSVTASQIGSKSSNTPSQEEAPDAVEEKQETFNRALASFDYEETDDIEDDDLIW